MQDQTHHGIETFLAEDLLVSLGAIRMALSWVEADTENGADAAHKIGLRRLGTELKALQDRALLQYRGLRQNGPVQMPLLPVTVAHPTAKAPPLPARPQPQGLAPGWLDSRAAVDLDAQEDALRPVPVDVQMHEPVTSVRVDSVEQTKALQPDPLGESIDELLASALATRPAHSLGPDPVNS